VLPPQPSWRSRAAQASSTFQLSYWLAAAAPASIPQAPASSPSMAWEGSQAGASFFHGMAEAGKECVMHCHTLSSISNSITLPLYLPPH